MTITDWLRQRCLARVIDTPIGDKNESLSYLIAIQWYPEFEQWMRNRLLCGRYRYGLMGDPSKGSYDCVASAIERLKLYQADGNVEHLVDVSNLCMIEAKHSRHPLKHFAATDDTIHVPKLSE